MRCWIGTITASRALSSNRGNIKNKGVRNQLNKRPALQGAPQTQGQPFPNCYDFRYLSFSASAALLEMPHFKGSHPTALEEPRAKGGGGRAAIRMTEGQLQKGMLISKAGPSQQSPITRSLHNAAQEPSLHPERRRPETQGGSAAFDQCPACDEDRQGRRPCGAPWGAVLQTPLSAPRAVVRLRAPARASPPPRPCSARTTSTRSAPLFCLQKCTHSAARAARPALTAAAGPAPRRAALGRPALGGAPSGRGAPEAPFALRAARPAQQPPRLRVTGREAQEVPSPARFPSSAAAARPPPGNARRGRPGARSMVRQLAVAAHEPGRPSGAARAGKAGWATGVLCSWNQACKGRGGFPGFHPAPALICKQGGPRAEGMMSGGWGGARPAAVYL